MKKLFLLPVACFFFLSALASNWITVTSQVVSPAKIRLVASDIDHSVVQFSFGGFDLREVMTPKGTAYTIALEKATPLLIAGAPDVPKLTASVVIPDLAGMNIRVVSSSYKDFPGILLAPSKGVITRDIDPSTVPYAFGKQYSTDKYFPGNLADTREPYILRDLRGQTIIVCPFQYNPVKKNLRVYYELTVELYKASENGVNPFYRSEKAPGVNREFISIYANQFLNFDNVCYAPLNDYGNMLVISYGSFMPAMLPYVNWKNASGIPTAMVDVATIGTTAAAIKSFIANYYNTNGLTFVLLVGDNAQIPTNQGSGLGGPSDNAYGYITGNDHFPEVFIGRFSAENITQVQTQVQRTLDYEKNPTLLADDWYTTVIGIASDQGPGDDGEFDYQHIRNMQTQLLAYTYTWNPELFDGSQGGNDAPGNPTPAQVATAVNEGAGLILYCGHGSETSWGTSGFSNNNVNNLTNQGKLPFIWSVACVNGAFMNLTCFAEAWMRASQNGQPTGAIAFLGSTINQSWNSPMEGQDEMVDILTESYPTNIKRTFAGLSINGCMKMIDSYGTDGQNMADTWTVFGDPSLIVRTDNPETMTVTHDPTLFVGSTSLTVTCNVNGARATASVGDSILATDLVANNTVVLTFAALTNPGDSVHLVVTAYNYLPYIADIPVITPNGPYVIYMGNMISDPTGNNNQLLDYGEEVNMTITLKNVGVAATSGLVVKLREPDPYISVTDSAENYGTMAPGETKSVQDAFHFQAVNHIPDGHVIPFEVYSLDGTMSWTSAFSVTAHAPSLGFAGCQVKDSTGNNNGRLDPGETAFLKIWVNNDGSSEAYDVFANLVSVNPFVTVTQSTQPFGNLAGGSSCAKYYSVTVDPAAPQGTTAPFLVEIDALKGISGSGTFNLVIGKIPALIVDYDQNNNSGPKMQEAMTSLGVASDYRTTNIPDTLDQYSAIFVCLGVYPDNAVLSNTDGQKLANYLNAGGMLYMEGGDTWKFDPPTPVHPMFKIDGVDDGQGDLGTILGYTGSFTDGMNFLYSGDNQYIDHISNFGMAFFIFKNQVPTYVNAVAYDGGTYRTVGSSFEFGGLTEGIYPSTKMHLMEEYLNFFGIQPPPLMASFIGFPTSVSPGSNVELYDYSTGAVMNWNWSFPGGTPSSSTEKNPVITYNAPGIYDVQLIVNNGVTSDTLVKTGYITVDYPTGTIDKQGQAVCTVLPNPNPGSFTIAFRSVKEQTADIRILNSFGKIVYSKDGIVIIEGQDLPVSLGSVPDGVYFITIRGKDVHVTRKIVVQK